jgi:hypothetical protein
VASTRFFRNTTVRLRPMKQLAKPSK